MIDAFSLAISLAVTAAIEYSQGRTFLGNAKSLSLFTLETNGPLTSQALFDPYTFTHFEHGLYYSTIVRLLGLSNGLSLALAVETLWEIAENSNWGIKRYRTAGYTYAGDSIANSLMDVLAMCVGYYLADTYLSTTVSVVLAVVVDWLMYYYFNDSFVQTFLKFFQ